MTGSFAIIGLAGAMIVGSTGATLAASGGQLRTVDYQRNDPQGMRATHALNLLEAQGFGQFSNFRRDGDIFSANVTKNGRTTTVLIDPSTNRIQRENGGSAM